MVLVKKPKRMNGTGWNIIVPVQTKKSAIWYAKKLDLDCYIEKQKGG